MSDKSENTNSPPLPAPPRNAHVPVEVMGGPVPEQESSADIGDYIDIVLRRKWLILTIITAAVLSGLIVSYAKKPLYRASGKIELSIQAPRVTKFDDMLMLGTQLQTREFMQTQLKLLKSQTLANRVIDKLDLGNNPAFNPPPSNTGPGPIGKFQASVKGTIKSLLEPVRPEATEPPPPDLKKRMIRKGIEAKFTGSLTVQPERDTTIFYLAFTSPSPTIARDAVNTLIQEFIAWQVDKKIEATITAKQRLEKQIELARIQLEKAEDRLNAFSRKAGIVSLNSNLNLIYSQLEEANKAYAAAQAERIHKETLYGESRKEGGSIPPGLESPLLQKLRADYSTVAGEYQEGNATFKDDYPKIQNIKAKMLTVEKQMKAEEGRILELIKNEYLTALKQEEHLKEDSESKKALALGLNDQAVQYKILEREVETSKLIHQSLFERSREIDAKVGTEIGNIQVVDWATLPLAPYTPNVSRNLLAALLAGMLCGLGLAFLLEYLDNTIKRVDEISDRFQVPVLGVLPLVQAERVDIIGRMVRLKPLTGFSESTRTVKASIQLSSLLDRTPKLLLVSSIISGEGKSTIAANLAQAFSSEEKVLLIDADLRKPALHKVFSTNGAKLNRLKGLSAFLSGMANHEEIIQDTGIPNLQLINSGPIPPNPAELLSSRRMRYLLAEIYNRFDRIIVDGPPATGFADALILGHYADGVVLVSTLGHTHREALRIFRKNIHNVGGRIIGAIVNKLSIASHHGGYYYKYYRYNRYYQPVHGKESASELPPAGTQ